MNRLLIVDDALIMRMKIRKVAEQAGWTIVGEANNGEVGVQMYHEHRPDLVTLDMVMPKLDGVGALKAIRAANPEANVVMISAVDQKDKLAECITSGAMDFIVKPFDEIRLLNFFRQTLQ
ncbi:MAG: response regulator [Planctomycetaceae bacterium]